MKCYFSSKPIYDFVLRNAKNPHCVALFCIENREDYAVSQGLTQISLISEILH